MPEIFDVTAENNIIDVQEIVVVYLGAEGGALDQSWFDSHVSKDEFMGPGNSFTSVKTCYQNADFRMVKYSDGFGYELILGIDFTLVGKTITLSGLAALGDSDKLFFTYVHFD